MEKWVELAYLLKYLCATGMHLSHIVELESGQISQFEMLVLVTVPAL